jgi:hypothetical protein
MCLENVKSGKDYFPQIVSRETLMEGNSPEKAGKG